jgi:lysophospholipase L1-like esterase
MLGHDGEATVDGIHFTDLGLMRYAELLYPVIKSHLK